MVRIGASGDPRSILFAAIAAAFWWADIAAGAAQELPSGGGPVPPVRRGANGQIELVPPSSAARPGADGHDAPKPSTPAIRREVAASRIRAALPAPPAGPPQPVIMVTPSTPRVRDTARRGTVVASYSVRMSDGSPFAGTVRFGPPYYDNKGVFALSGNNIIVNPDGPGLGPNRTTIVDHVTLEAVPEAQNPSR
jgi:hypothetical protein